MLLLNVHGGGLGKAKTNFNTSYVVIKLYGKLPNKLQRFNFNTSYVVIKLIPNVDKLFYKKYFNTSYVVIKLM